MITEVHLTAAEQHVLAAIDHLEEYLNGKDSDGLVQAERRI